MSSNAMMAFAADFGSAVMNQGSFALQKLAHRDQEALHADKNQSIFSTQKGSLGTILLIAAIPLHIAALAYADLTLLSVNASTGILANVIISTIFLDERFNPRYDIPGLALIAIGCTMIVILSNKQKPLSDVDEIIRRTTSF